VRWYTPDGTERTKGGFRTRKEAMAFAAKADAETLTGMDFDPGKGKMLFQDAAAIWLESRKADTRNNGENHRYALARPQPDVVTARRSALTPCSAVTRSTRSPASTSRSG
jgi:hypothetical protein